MPDLLKFLNEKLVWFLSIECYVCYDLEARISPNNCCNYPKTWKMWFYPRVMHPKDADGMANIVDLDQTAPLLFVQTCLSENLGLLQYSLFTTSENVFIFRWLICCWEVTCAPHSSLILQQISQTTTEPPVYIWRRKTGTRTSSGEKQNLTCQYASCKVHFVLVLAHLSRRLIGELIV